MRKQSWTKRDPIKNYFPLPNEIYDLELSRGAILVYSFLLRREDRKTYQCLLSYREIAEELNLSQKTVEAHMHEALRFLRDNLALLLWLALFNDGPVC